MYVYTPTVNPCDPIGMSRFIAMARYIPGGPCPSLGGVKNCSNLGTSLTGAQPIDGSGSATRAVGLISCAAVIYTSLDPDAAAVAWVHHSNTGTINAGDVRTALARIGGAPAQVQVVYAFQKPRDDGYDSNVANIIAAGVPTDNVVMIPDLPLNMFGIDSLARIGT